MPGRFRLLEGPLQSASTVLSTSLEKIFFAVVVVVVFFFVCLFCLFVCLFLFFGLAFYSK